MKAIVTQGDEAQQDLALADVPVPQIDAHEVLVRVKAIGVGLHDRWFLPQGIQFPYPIGIEGAGVVERSGVDATRFAPGDRVVFVNSGQVKGGVWAEFTAVPEHALVPMPAALDFVRAAALPVAGGTAIGSLRQLGINQGNTLFVAGASGAIGTLALQLAVSRGARVAASASPANHDYLRSLGAELAVDYGAPDWVEQVRFWANGGVDAALAIQPDTGNDSMHTVRDGGRVVTVSGDQMQPEREIHVEQVLLQGDHTDDLRWLVEEVAAGRIRVEVEEVFAFTQAIDALRKTETRHARGKTVIAVE